MEKVLASRKFGRRWFILCHVGSAVQDGVYLAQQHFRIEWFGDVLVPNDGRFNLSFTLDNKGTTRLSVMDSQGKEVFVETVAELSGQYNRQIDLTPFGPGLYFLQIAQGKKYHTKRILVN